MTATLSVDLDALAAEVRAEHEAIEEAARSAAVGAARSILPRRIALGERLNRIREQIPHGEWLPWLAEKARIPQRTAWEWMFLARHKVKLVSDTNLTVPVALKILRGQGLVSPTEDAEEPLPEQELPRDGLGLYVPDRLLSVWALLPAWDEAEERLRLAVAVVETLQAGPSGYALDCCDLACRLHDSPLFLSACRPYASVCPTCQDSTADLPAPACAACGGRGWLTRSEWESAPVDRRARLLTPPTED